MKNRSKMILGLASMLGISAGAAAVSGFAWFTTQRTADISAGSFKVGAGQGALKISKVGTPVNTKTVDNNTTNIISVTPADGTLEDVSSGDGKTFHKATLNTTGTALSTIVKETGSTSLVNSGQMVYVSWDVQVENTVKGTELDVYVSNDGKMFKQNLANSKTTQHLNGDSTTKVFTLDIAFDKIESVKVGAQQLAAEAYTYDKATKKITFTGETAPNGDIEVITSIDYSDCYRLAIYDVAATPANDKLVFLHTSENNLSFITAADKTNLEDPEQANPGLDGTGLLHKTGDDKDCVVTPKVITGTLDADEKDTVEQSNQLLIKGLKADENETVNHHTLRFVVWCEGTATPEAAAVASNAVDLALNLVSVTPAQAE